MIEIKNKVLEGERALYDTHNAKVIDCVFQNGESPLKESDDLEVLNCTFKWKYPLWYCNNVVVKNCMLEEMARSGIWYTNNIEMSDCTIIAPKLFRRCNGVKINRCDMPNALEMFWNTKNVEINDCTIKGDYLGFNNENVKVNNVKLLGNYAFDGATNVEINNCYLESKDSFWNCKNVIVRNSTIIGEYLGWNSQNLVFENCTIESNQGLCYIDGLKMINCKLVNTDLCFELCSNIDAEINSDVISIKNPISGVIKVKSVSEIIIHENLVDKNKTKIIVG